ncbi:bifunctional phosphoribosyl-AMP cyclohydrolase/phosphoribosyl-ATP diphosphatase [Candidatus Pantoea edessiphila]|uniref:Histidine biosynthesis bifunctional protein HisIE n=1 Tax=Candidatus Pantoea edessiphila TaxID=2044610 RepID=A0A2P5SYK8_9GAMM|nr:bifunctional phosphoribosyl-AMP cyclohydrolase/phosphoribosyl-ATP diphosphatase HisIE [Candidatus Pantoea edessiphila]MBK4775459.1 bifunctional phosphoribosyl-AMP cyclohydrolase/phosphoribosyl-ATP diphosphatase HisIE [Pantoea sp. Edef]PPI87414.1 bifunctional phosphoribosyl-AMP cyclohydrolase/phosphoribosyl-ATP diphosphatase [Candidatus Pantoea edessiphila]
MLNINELSFLDWKKTQGMIPTIIQHYVSGQVLMHGYMNKQALEYSLTKGNITFFSRTKRRLWTKGEKSGNVLKLIDIKMDCDHDSILILVNPTGPTCHLGNTSCFSNIETNLLFLYKLEKLLFERKNDNPEISYTARLYARGTKRIAQKIGEEGIECALAAISRSNNNQELINETSDLIYHLLVLLNDQNLDLSVIIKNLKKRHINNNFDNFI